MGGLRRGLLWAQLETSRRPRTRFNSGLLLLQELTREWSGKRCFCCARSRTSFVAGHANHSGPYETSTSCLMLFNSARTSRRRVIAWAVWRPCLKAFLLPFGGPVDLPPCSRQRPLRIAGARHELALRVRAPHWGARCMGNCMGSFLSLARRPSPRGLN